MVRDIKQGVKGIKVLFHSRRGYGQKNAVQIDIT